MLHVALLGLEVSAIAFAIGWAVCVRLRNYAFLDAIWSLSIGGLACWYSCVGTGSFLRRTLYACAALTWSLRLGGYVLLRVAEAHPKEDPRYRSLRERWGGPFGFLLFFEIQAVVAFIFSIPFLIASFGGAEPISSSEAVGLGIAVLCVALETTADAQARRFNKLSDAEKRGRDGILDTGLWRYSRHPNYFFESLVWCGFCVATLDRPAGWITLLCPSLILYFLLRVTGIPLTEKHSIESHGEAYRDYQRRTSRFIPWPPK